MGKSKLMNKIKKILFTLVLIMIISMQLFNSYATNFLITKAVTSNLLVKPICGFVLLVVDGINAVVTSIVSERSPLVAAGGDFLDSEKKVGEKLVEAAEEFFISPEDVFTGHNIALANVDIFSVSRGSGFTANELLTLGGSGLIKSIKGRSARFIFIS